MPPGYVIVAAEPQGLVTLEERTAPTRVEADTEFDALVEKYPGARVYLGDHRANVLREYPASED